MTLRALGDHAVRPTQEASRKTLPVLSLLPLLALGAFTAQEAVQPTSKLEQHEWLQQLVGEWTVSSEAAAGGESAAWESTESIRSIGGLWIVAEGTADDAGQPFTSLLTLGYDPNKEAFVGTWIDSIQTTLWTCTGHLDESRRTLTLEAEGPGFSDPTRTSRYRDQIELVGPDEKRMISSVLGDDGAWATYMTVSGRRVK